LLIRRGLCFWVCGLGADMAHACICLHTAANLSDSVGGWPGALHRRAGSSDGVAVSHLHAC
jgi:hypothetical protein